MANYYRYKYKRHRRPYKKFSQRNFQNKEPIVHSDEVSSRWQKLLKYYFACISVENAGDITLYSSSEWKDFIQVPDKAKAEKEWLASGREKLEIDSNNSEMQDFISGPRWSKRPSPFFYGFPCHVKYIEQSRSGWTGNILQPILIFGIDPIKTEKGYSFVLQSDRPRINSAFLTDRSLLTSIEERKHVAEAVLGLWDENRSRAQNIRMILKSIAEIISQEVSFSKDVLSGKTSNLKESEKTSNGIYPIAIVFKGQGSPYTFGLEQEVAELRDTSNPNDVWRLILERNGNENESITEDRENTELLEITALNDEQRNAIKSAFSNILTVVTGPPGTGKSQIVLNIVANALLHNETVLFGSKNHKAVDVVIERLLRLQSEPVILKYGQREREVEFAESLLSAIERSAGYDSKTLEREIDECKKEIDIVRLDENRAKETLLRILERRNVISGLDAELEQVKKELPKSIANNLSQYRLLKYNEQFITPLGKLENFIKQSESRPNLFSRFLAIFGRTLEKRIFQKTSQLLAVFPIRDVNLLSDTIHRCKEIMVVAQLLKRWGDTQKELIDAVKQNESESPIEVLRERITKSRERLVDVSIKYVDVLMRKRLKTLGSTERRDIADYVSIVRRLEGDVTGGELAEKLRKERKRMFQSVVRAFPAMAVTNLSVRHALPLTPEIVDVAVIDEASQCDIVSALPLVYRAKRAIIIGDPNQLTHISMLHRADDQQLQQQMGLTSSDDQRFLYSISSFFDLGRTVVGTGAKFVHLLEHYRSRAEIIDFSNKKFYGNKLSIWTDYRKLRGADYPDAVTWHNVIGEVVRPSQGSAYNLEEAKQVVELIQKIVKSIFVHGNNYVVSLGVVTPFRAQANKIRDLVEQKIDVAQLRKLDFIVDTAHKYQGDERDIMIFSPVVSRRTPQRSLGFLGNTVNLFNVAITRARTELHIVGDRVACAQSGIPHLKDFVEYVEQLEPESINRRGGVFESPWEKVLYNALNKKGVHTIPQYPLYQYRLDLAVVDSEIPIDIEVDGEFWHRDIDGGRLLSDLKRDQHLIIHGWQVKRFWVYQLQNNLLQCVQEVKDLIKKYPHKIKIKKEA